MNKNIIKIRKYVIGCANFGQRYGLIEKKLKFKEFKEIFKLSIDKNLMYFDTAADYGNSEELLGNIIKNQKNRVKIITKLPKKMYSKNFDTEMENQVLKSIKRLKVKSLYALHIHEPNMLLNKDKFKIYNCFMKLKKKKINKKYRRFSIYRRRAKENFKEV